MNNGRKMLLKGIGKVYYAASLIALSLVFECAANARGSEGATNTGTGQMPKSNANTSGGCLNCEAGSTTTRTDKPISPESSSEEEPTKSAGSANARKAQ